ncbi:MAG: 2-iminobutanoate/2-iminopropanoate deaminase, partial [Planctomycetota bacterium]
DSTTGQPPADAGEEARLVLDGIRARLELVGLTMDDLVSVQVFCSDVELYGVFNDVYRTYFDGAYPTRSFIGSGELLFGCHFEVNGIAVCP